MKYILSLCIGVLAIPFLLSQSGPTIVGKADKMVVIPSLESRTHLEPQSMEKKEMQDGRSSRVDVTIGKDPQTHDDFFVREKHPLSQKKQARTPELVFDAVQVNSFPTDPSIAVGQDYVMSVFNTGFKVFNKNGVPQTGLLSATNIFGGTDSQLCCDLTVSYDKLAHRWVLSILNDGPGAKVAVSSSSNPLTSSWYVYTYSQVFDYQKLSVWSDGYYMTDNTGATNKVYVFERDKMLLGDTNAQILAFPLSGIATSGFYSPQVLSISSDDFPAAGNATVVYMQDNAWNGVSSDHLKVWTIDVDWDTPSNSTSSTPTTLPTTPFIGVFDGGGFSNLQQPNGGSNLDALQATIMNQAQFRKFPTHNSAVFNFVVDADASGGKLAAIRWFELRQSGDGQPWSIYQEGTYTAADGKHAWNASLVMDAQGNIGMGYTGMGGSLNKKVGSYYTGRLASDPLNTMTVAEEIIAEGTQNISGNRYGDYSKIDIDPDGDLKFWFINEYMNPSRKNVVGVFQLAPELNYDTGIIDITQPTNGSLSANESVTVVINNYGQNAVSNIPVELYLNTTLVATETYTGTIGSGATANFTFSQTLDLSTEGTDYILKSCTALSSDELTDNDCYEEMVRHEYSTDIGVVNILSPESTNMTGPQQVTVEIQNFGTQNQSNFPVAYSVDGAAEVIETYTGTLNAGATQSFTFSTPHDFTQFGDYTIMANTQLNNDSVLENNSLSKDISIQNCFNYENTTSQSVGPWQGDTTLSTININESSTISEVNVTMNINHTYVGDIEASLISPMGTEVLLTSANGGSGANYTNTTFDDDASESITEGNPPFTGTYSPEGNLSDFNGENAQGEWTLKIEDLENWDGGTLLNWNLNICASLDVEDITPNSSSVLQIAEKSNKIFQVELGEYQSEDEIPLYVYNSNGQLLKFQTVSYNGSAYLYELDMSYAPSGMYLVKLGKYAQKILVD